MTISSRASLLGIVIAAFVGVGFFSAPFAEALHSWGGYHWARKTSSFTLKLGDNVNTTWDAYLATASTDWSADPSVLYPSAGIVKVLNTVVLAGNGTKNCQATSGTVQVCNKTYGNNGWLGIASIWISGTHITQGTVKLNDTYFNTSSYNKPAWRNMVMCQEIGHTFGLDHQDENFSNLNLGTCMDYTNNPARNDGAGDNQHPNLHDYDELALIYAHLDSFDSFKAFSASKPGASLAAQSGDFENASEWGKEIRKDSRGHSSLFERDLGKGDKVFTFVIWVQNN